MIVREIEKYDSRVHLIVSSSNFGGPARPRNLGIKASSGEYIAFLDSDDIWYKHKLEECMPYFNASVDIVYHDLICYGSVNFFYSKKMKGRSLNSPTTEDLLLKGNALNNSSVIIKRSILEKVGCLDEANDMIAAEDYNLWLKVSQNNSNFLYIPKVLGKYLVGDENISSKDMSKCMEYASRNFVNSLNDEQYKKYIARIQYIHSRFLYKNNKYNLVVPPLLYVIKYGAFDLRIRSLYTLCCSFVMLLLTLPILKNRQSLSKIKNKAQKDSKTIYHLDQKN